MHVQRGLSKMPTLLSEPLTESLTEHEFQILHGHGLI
jgi:hypothetical protein